jgi:hypothetical protein
MDTDDLTERVYMIRGFSPYPIVRGDREDFPNIRIDAVLPFVYKECEY